MPLRRMKAVHAIEVYIGERGYVCIRQEDPLGDTAEIIALLPQQVPAVCQWLQECAGEILARGGDRELSLMPASGLRPSRAADSPSV